MERTVHTLEAIENTEVSAYCNFAFAACGGLIKSPVLRGLPMKSLDKTGPRVPAVGRRGRGANRKLQKAAFEYESWRAQCRIPTRPRLRPHCLGLCMARPGLTWRTWKRLGEGRGTPTLISLIRAAKGYSGIELGKSITNILVGWRIPRGSLTSNSSCFRSS